MTTQIEEDLTRLVLQSFATRESNSIKKVKDFCLTHFNAKLMALQDKMACSQSAYYEKEILLVNNSIEVMLSGWLPGNICYPHDHDQAECFVFVLNGTVENSLLRFYNSALEPISKTTKQSGDNMYLADGIIHYMQNTGNDNLICLHVYTPGISEMKVYDEKNKTIYTLNGEASAWLPAKKDHIIMVSTYGANEVGALV